MTLAAGTRLGPYEILSALGAGGPPSRAAARFCAALRQR
jgi:hypothetical protein